MNEEQAQFDYRLNQQEETIDTLNKMVYQQQLKIDELESLCKALALRLGELSLNSNQRGNIVDERPPHY